METGADLEPDQAAGSPECRRPEGEAQLRIEPFSVSRRRPAPLLSQAPERRRGGVSSRWVASAMSGAPVDLAIPRLRSDRLAGSRSEWDALAPHYRAVAQMLPVSGPWPTISSPSFLPVHNPRPQPLKLSRQGQALDSPTSMLIVPSSKKQASPMARPASPCGPTIAATAASACPAVPMGFIYWTDSSPWAAMVAQKTLAAHFRLAGHFGRGERFERVGACGSPDPVRESKLDGRPRSVFLAAGTFATTKILLSSMQRLRS